MDLGVIQSNILFDIGIIIIFATLVSYFFRLIKQPSIPAYIVTGVLIGPSLFKLITNLTEIKVLAELGIAFLLFIVGLEINVKKLKEVGFVSTIGGLVIASLMFVIGFSFSNFFGFGSMNSIYMGIILAFSSTMIVIKLLSDKRELGTLHGRIILGMLLLQDLIAILALAFFSAGGEFVLSNLVMSVIKAVGLFVIALLMGKFVLPGIFKISAKSHELLFLSSISVCFFFALFTLAIGFESIVIGAFIAGLALATLPYNFEIAGRIKPLRDFFATLFFVSLGMQISFVGISSIIIPVIIFILIILTLKPVITILVTSLSGYKKRTSFLTGIYLAQISEFSLILASQGLILGQISQNVFSITIFSAVVTMVITPYIFKEGDKIYNSFSGIFSFTDKFPTHREKLGYHSGRKKEEVVIFGCHRLGSILLRGLKKKKKGVFVIDYDPVVIRHLMKEKVNCMYGDLTNEEVLDQIDFNQSKVVISTMPGLEDNIFLLDYIKSINPKAIVILTSRDMIGALKLYEAGADYVILPRLISGSSVSEILAEVLEDKKKVANIKEDHLEYLLNTKIMGEEH